MASTSNRTRELASRQTAANVPSTAATSTNPTASLLRTTPSTTMYGAIPTPQRPLLPHAQTTTVVEETTTATPNLSRPLLTHAATTTAVPRTTTRPATRPGLLHRIFSGIDLALELSTESSYAHRNRPAQPSHWTDYAHREALLKTWDEIHEAGPREKSEQSRSVAGQLEAIEKSILLQFPELAEGGVVLGREWMEYVLGVSLRQPFCSEGKMGKWEVLSGAAKVGGLRAWGPW
ncbi:hypothetical protein MBLNU13_g02430t1 [Cladosporium sp. NU13]